MNPSSNDVPMILFAVLAIFVLWKLRSVLGANVDQRQRGPDDKADPLHRVPFAQPLLASKAEAMLLDRLAPFGPPDTPIWSGLKSMIEADARFDPQEFLRGADAAYAMIVTAFAAGDRETLKRLLSPDVFESFESAISASESRGEKRQTTVVSMKKTEFQDVHLVDGEAFVTVRFHSQLLSATHSKDGALIEGDTQSPADHVDDWTFSRGITAMDPNWRLTRTLSQPV